MPVMLRRFCWSVIFTVSLSVVARADEAQKLDFFEKRIRPVLSEHCYECHSKTSRPVRAGLLLDNREGTRRGGESGAAVAPGDPDASLLLAAMRHDGFEMPPKGKLSDEIVADFEKWIADGAVDPRDSDGPSGDSTRRADENFWSYQPIVRPQPPAVDNAAWAATAIDRFVLARLEQQGLQPAQSSNREVLLRRLTFDLTGLPPTREMREQFLSDSRPEAYEELIDSLLASPAFGERWGRHWLDVARFAESTGGGRTKVFDSAWRYRDYVVRSFNNDKPFNRFAAEQVAGDLLPHKDLQSQQDGLIATGFLVLGPINYELQDKELLRLEVIDEQLDVLGRAVLGMSIGCARCHDHKFERLSIDEYYSLAGVFHSTRSLTPGNVSGFVMRPLPMEKAKNAEYKSQQAEIGKLNQQIAEIDRRLKGSAPSAPGRVDAKSLPGIAIDNQGAKKTGEWTKSTSIAGYIGDEYIHDNNAGAKPKWVAYEAKLPKGGEYEILASYTASSNRASNTLIEIHHSGQVVAKRINQRKSPPINKRFVSLGVFSFSPGDVSKVVIRSQGANGVVIADCVQWLPRGAKIADGLAKTTKPDGAAAKRKQKEQLALTAQKKRLQTQLKTLQAAAINPPLIMSVEDQAKPADFFVCVRGNVHQKGVVAPRRFPTSLGGASAGKVPANASGRLQLANWLAAPSNPRTSRVIVNRVWRHLFGTGIVRTTDDFGPMGEPPSHPELLDFLAAELIADGWSMKRLIRRIALTRTYQLSAVCDEALRITDPDNRLFGRREPRRLDAEALRDAMLSVSGLLDDTLGGKTLKPNTRSEFGYKFDNVANRRSIYVPILRNSLHDFLNAFDLADPNLVSGNRSVSTLPSQSLLLMNSPEVMRVARSAGRRLLKESYADDDARLNAAFVRFFGRRPTSRERELAEAFLTANDAADAESRWARFCHSLLASIDFRYVK